MRDDAGRPLRFAYDLDHRLIGFEDWLGGHHWVEYLPNDCGEVWMIAGDLRVHRRRDPMGRLISVNVTHDGGSLFSEVCRYDEQGRLAAHNDSISGEAQPAATRAIERDAQGRPVRCNGEELAFDTAGRVIARRQADGAQWRYTWNSRGQLATVRTPQGRETRFAYDALGRVLRRHAAATTTRLIWAGDMLVGDEITHTGGAIQARRFAVHPFSGEPLLMRLKRYAAQGDLPVQDQVFVIHCGTSGQPRVVTNGRAEVVWASGMDASSELQPVLARVEWPLRGPAHYADDANGLVLTRNRPYIPALGLHLSPHPLGLLAGADAYGQETAEGNWLAGVVGEVGASAGVLAGTAALATGWRVNPGSSRPFDGATLASALANGLQRPVREPPEGLQCTVGRRYRLWPEPGTTDPLLASLERGVHRALREALVRIAGPVAPPVDSEQHARHAEALRRRPPNPVPPRTHP